MSGYDQAQRPAAQTDAERAAPDHRLEAAPRGSALASTMVDANPQPDLAQLGQALDSSARIEAQLALQRALNGSGEQPVRDAALSMPALPAHRGDVAGPDEDAHAMQQKPSRVKPSLQPKRVAINSDATLESEATMMGAQANSFPTWPNRRNDSGGPVMQLYLGNTAALYDSAAQKWQRAHDAAVDFDQELDKAAAQSTSVKTSGVAQTLKERAIAKAKKADTTLAGEAAEPLLWNYDNSSGPTARGPGGGKGIDIVTYQFGSAPANTSVLLQQAAAS